mmetsp:Transcript_99673/g.266301  ORF Transcript_99673/g.266301 Transcript_99673/m.266301 type:complete len:679 (+) Transcript_99673:413-2449(+)
MLPWLVGLDAGDGPWSQACFGDHAGRMSSGIWADADGLRVGGVDAAGFLPRPRRSSTARIATTSTPAPAAIAAIGCDSVSPPCTTASAAETGAKVVVSPVGASDGHSLKTAVSTLTVDTVTPVNLIRSLSCTADATRFNRWPTSSTSLFAVGVMDTEATTVPSTESQPTRLPSACTGIPANMASTASDTAVCTCSSWANADVVTRSTPSVYLLSVTRNTRETLAAMGACVSLILNTRSARGTGAVVVALTGAASVVDDEDAAAVVVAVPAGPLVEPSSTSVAVVVAELVPPASPPSACVVESAGVVGRPVVVVVSSTNFGGSTATITVALLGSVISPRFAATAKALSSSTPSDPSEPTAAASSATATASSWIECVRTAWNDTLSWVYWASLRAGASASASSRRTAVSPTTSTASRDTDAAGTPRKLPTPVAMAAVASWDQSSAVVPGGGARPMTKRLMAATEVGSGAGVVVGASRRSALPIRSCWTYTADDSGDTRAPPSCATPRITAAPSAGVVHPRVSTHRRWCGGRLCQAQCASTPEGQNTDRYCRPTPHCALHSRHGRAFHPNFMRQSQPMPLASKVPEAHLEVQVRRSVVRVFHRAREALASQTSMLSCQAAQPQPAREKQGLTSSGFPAPQNDRSTISLLGFRHVTSLVLNPDPHRSEQVDQSATSLQEQES